jgi:Na+/H+ antiporter NhaC
MEFTQKVYEGFTMMTEIFLLSMLSGGLAAMVDKAGGIDYILSNKDVLKVKSQLKWDGTLVGD